MPQFNTLRSNQDWDVRLKQGVGDWYPIAVLGLGLAAASLQGLSLADRGYHLFNQLQLLSIVSAGKSPDIHASLLWLGSDALGAIWLSLSGEFSVIWARLGGVLLFSCSACVLAVGLSRFAPVRASVRISALVYLFLACNDDILIQYCTVPSFLTVLLLTLLCLRLRSGGRRRNLTIAFLVGLCLWLIVLSKVTFVFVLIFPLLIIALLPFLERGKSTLVAEIGFVYLGVTTAAVISMAFVHRLGIFHEWSYAVTGLFGGAVDNSAAIVSERSNRIGRYLQAYLRDALGAAILGVGLWIVLIWLSRAHERVLNFAFRPWNVALLTAGAFVVIRVVLGGSQPLQYRLTLMLLGWWVIAGADLALRSVRAQPGFALLVFFCVLILPLHALGSDLGLWKAVYGAPFLAGILLSDRFPSSDGRGRVVSPSLLNRKFGGLLLVALLSYSMCRFVDFTYADGPGRWVMTSSFREGALWGQFATSEKASSVDGLLRAVHQFTAPGSSLVAVPSCPLLYLLAERPSYLGRAWLHKVDPSNVARLLHEEASKGLAPGGVVVSLWDPSRQPAWPIGAAPRLSPDRQARVDAVRAFFVGERGYVKVFSNRAFELFVPAAAGGWQGSGAQ